MHAPSPGSGSLTLPVSRDTVVSDVSGATVKVHVPQRGIWGTASVDGLNVDPSIRSTKYEVDVVTERLDDVVTEQAIAAPAHHPAHHRPTTGPPPAHHRP